MDAMSLLPSGPRRASRVRRRILAATFATALASSARVASALQQPGGETIPVGGSLQGLFDARGEAIDALAVAATEPETFTPACALTFEVVQRNATFRPSFGWYNVTGSKPQPEELQEILSCLDEVGAVDVVDLTTDPEYAGGEVGFYEATGPCATVESHDHVFYSEKAYNPDSSATAPLVHLIVYGSTVAPSAFYFAWEDLLNGGDNDFDDLTTLVSGITCAGGGGACDTGKPGVCSLGSEQCQGGALVCLPLVAPSTETCDGLDNDCDGAFDEDDRICPADHVCDNGICVPPCGSGEFACGPGESCDRDKGLCVEEPCLGVECPPGETCAGGACVAPCDGVVCPYAQTCLAGHCVDPCGLFVCDSDHVCVAGVCALVCQCTGCAPTDACQADGRCIPLDCVGTTCPPGFHCVNGGECADDCEGASCPKGETCIEGECVPDGAGGSASAAGVGVGGGASGTGGVGESWSAGGAPAARGGEPGGCGCRATGGDPRSAACAWLGALALALRWRRSVRRPAPKLHSHLGSAFTYRERSAPRP